jgi:signal transduction histidine kinase/CheY-like chemotaxis protein
MYTSITNKGVSIKNKMIENYYILNQIVQGIDTGIVIIYNKTLLHINNEMRRIAKRTYKDIESDLVGAIAPAFRISVLRSYISVLKGFSDKQEFYFDMVLPDGGIKSVKCRIVRIKIFESNGIFATVHEEFSEVKRDTQMPLTLCLWRKYRSDYEHILTKEHDFVAFVDTYCKIKNISHKVVNFLGYDRKEFLEKRFENVCEVTPLEDFLDVLDGFQKNTSSNLIVKDLQLELTKKDGKKLRFSVSFFDVKFRRYSRGYCMIFKMLKQPERQNLNTDDIAANIAHEFRSPLNAIIGFSNIIADENISNYERNQYLKYIKQSCSSLLTIVNDFSDFNKLNHDKIIIHKDDFNINALFEQLDAYCSIYKNNYNKPDIQVVSSLQQPDGEVIINSDYQRVLQIMLNLLNNAFKFTEKGFIKYQYIIENGFLVLKVSDSGIGIPKENLSKIFNRMTQLDVKNSNKGSGLGLAISKHLVELMGGVILVNSEVGVGTEFLVKLPVGQDINRPKNKLPLQKEEYDFSNKTIIIAEDAQINYILLAKILEKTHIKILWAKNGRECVDMFILNKDISLILMDIQMPEMDGFEAVKKILEIDPKVPIIAQTAFSYSEEKKRILSLGCVDYISKPIDKNILYKKMAKILNPVEETIK